MQSKKLVRIRPRLDSPSPLEVPIIPRAFRRSDYDGLLLEKIKRLQLQSFQKTQEERLEVLRQINELQSQCMVLSRNEADRRHFGQEDRLRKKRLDVDEMELDIKLEELVERRRRTYEKPVREASRPSDPTRDAIERLRHKLRTGAEARSECDQVKEEFPEQTEEIEREFRKILADLRER